MISRSSFNIEFWLLTIGLLFLWTLVWSTTYASASPSVIQSSQKQLRRSNEKKLPLQERNCKTLCKQCGCMGFYCGEECICECNNANSKIGTECLAGMRIEAMQRRIPFQLIIQGPKRNRFLRKALEYSQKTFGAPVPLMTDVKKRSSALIYKPVLSPNLLESHSITSGNKRSSTSKNLDSKRRKRSVGHFDWFSDFANTFVRPALKANPSLNSDEAVAQTNIKRATNKQETDRQWFSDSPNLLLSSVPLFKKQRANSETVGAKQDAAESSKDDDSSFELPIRAVSKFPKVLQDTLRNLHDQTIGGEAASELGNTLRTHIKEGANALQSQFSDGNLEFLPTNGALSENIQQTLSQFFALNNDNDHPTEMVQQQQRITLPKLMPKKFTWLRPVRFLQRVHQAIN